MTDQETLHTMLLTRALPMNATMQNLLLDRFGSATELYDHRHHLRDALPDATDRLVSTVASMDLHIGRAEEELHFTQKGHIRCLGRTDSDYPARLRECPDAPALLYYRGSADLNRLHIISMVGTRHCTDYGKRLCQRFLDEMAALAPDVLVVSGLAYGIDIQSHRQALAHGLDTVGVLAHGLDQIYPRLHRDTAVEMLSHGGLLTEFMSRSTTEKMNFVSRNRIVAGMADATVVVESKCKGGSLITAELAQDYGREVFAFPGRVGDEMSEGCNALIRDNRATLLLTAEDLSTALGWQPAINKKHPIQREIFPDLTPDEQHITAALKDGEPHDLNQLAVATDLPVTTLSTLLFDLEMRGVVRTLNGGRYIL